MYHVSCLPQLYYLEDKRGTKDERGEEGASLLPLSLYPGGGKRTHAFLSMNVPVTQNGNCNYVNESLVEVISEEDSLVYKMNN